MRVSDCVFRFIMVDIVRILLKVFVYVVKITFHVLDYCYRGVGRRYKAHLPHDSVIFFTIIIVQMRCIHKDTL